MWYLSESNGTAGNKDGAEAGGKSSFGEKSAAGFQRVDATEAVEREAPNQTWENEQRGKRKKTDKTADGPG